MRERIETNTMYHLHTFGLGSKVLDLGTHERRNLHNYDTSFGKSLIRNITKRGRTVRVLWLAGQKGRTDRATRGVGMGVRQQRENGWWVLIVCFVDERSGGKVVICMVNSEHED